MASFRSFFIKTITCAAPLVLLLTALEATVAFAPTTYSQKKELLDKAAPRVEALIMGSSHPYSGLDPHAFRAYAFNLANASQQLRYDEKLLEHYLPLLPRLSLVVFTISYHSLGTALESGPEAWRTFFYERYFGIPAPFPWHDPRHFSQIARYGGPLKASAIAGKWLRHDPSLDRFDEQGKVIGIRRQLLDPVRAQTRAQDHTSLIRGARKEPIVAGLRAMTDQLAARGIRVAFVTLPAHRMYTRHLDRAWLDSTVATMKTFERPGYAIYRNYLDDPRFEDGDFWDYDHLSPKGGLKMGRILDAEIAQAGLYGGKSN